MQATGLSRRAVEEELSPLPAANPWNAVPWAQPSSSVPCLLCPHHPPAPAGSEDSAEGLCCAQTSPKGAPPAWLWLIPALAWQGAGVWRWGELEDMQEGFGSKNASWKCS